jgi:hypothetical protein
MYFTLRLPEDKVLSAFRSLNASMKSENFSLTLSRMFGTAVAVKGSYSLTKIDFTPTMKPTNPPHDKPTSPSQERKYGRADFSILFCPGLTNFIQAYST